MDLPDALPWRAFRVGHAWRTIRQIFAELVAGHDHQADINTSLPECSIQMDHVHNQKIASCRHLHLDAFEYSGSIYSLDLIQSYRRKPSWPSRRSGRKARQ